MIYDTSAALKILAERPSKDQSSLGNMRALLVAMQKQFDLATPSDASQTLSTQLLLD